jgi:carboxypeptidase C (cathepsin A)
VAAAPTAAVAPAAFVPTFISDTVTYNITGKGSLKKTEAVERSAQSKHEIQLRGKRFDYLATAGHLNIVDPNTTDATASFFYVAYTKDGAAGAASRPVTFFYNGGPGSSSVWLHLGSYGPRRLDIDALNLYHPLPGNVDGIVPDFSFVDNEETLLDTTDLVFVDAIGTGYSQAVEPRTNLYFWSVDTDAAAFRDFVIRYLDANQRKSSPLYLFGESYGGPRTAVLSRLLTEANYLPAGIVLQSPVLNFNANCNHADPTNLKNIPCAGFFPSYAAVAAYFEPSLIPVGKSLAEYLEQDVPGYVAGTYTPAWEAYLASRKSHATTKVLDGIADTMKTRFGVELKPQKANRPKPVAMGTPYNPQPDTVYSTSMMFPFEELSYYDARVKVSSHSRWSKGGDPAITLLNDSYAANIKDYLSTQLNYAASSVYALHTDARSAWNFTHKINGKDSTGVLKKADTIPDLQGALRGNPNMKILAMSGYHDLATPFYQTKLDLDRLTGKERDNLSVKNYEGGHMIYLTPASRVLARADLKVFYGNNSP